jgi:hypothetical protein
MSRPIGGRHWRQFDSEAAVAEFQRLLAIWRCSDPKGPAVLQSFDSVPSALRSGVYSNAILHLSHKALLDLLREDFRSGDSTQIALRLEHRRERRGLYRRLVSSDAYWNLIANLFSPDDDDPNPWVAVQFLVEMIDWLEVASMLHSGALGDTHLFAAKLAADEALDQSMINSALDRGDDELASKWESERGPELPPGFKFDVSLLGHSKGNSQASARAWIIRQLNVIIPSRLTPSLDRYATISQLLTLADIPVDSVFVRTTATRQKA